MKQIHNPEKLRAYLDQYHIEDLFSTKQLSFQLWQYERGEYLNYLRDSATRLRFMVSGEVQIYTVHSDGSFTSLCYVDSFDLLGDMEFCGESADTFLVEATRPVLCVELPLHHCRELLLDDNTFLRFLLRSVAHKAASIKTDLKYTTIEQKLLNHLRCSCPGGELRGIEGAAVQLRCSRRQLQRVLRDLCEKGVLAKQGKGVYKLIKPHNTETALPFGRMG